MLSYKHFIAAGTLIVVAGLACTKESNDATQSDDTGTGGSLARFTIAHNHLYLADYNSLKVYDLTDPATPVQKNAINVGFGVETIYPYGDKLFIGSRDGMYIYSITDPGKPVKLGEARHVRSCDPVVANDTVAYVTLRGNSACGSAQDGLYVYDIKNITNPLQKSLLPLSQAGGLGLRDSVVFISRGNAGLSVVNIKNPESPTLMYTVNDAEYMDVIPYNDVLLCYVSNGLLVYDISDLDQIKKIGGVEY